MVNGVQTTNRMYFYSVVFFFSYQKLQSYFHMTTKIHRIHASYALCQNAHHIVSLIQKKERKEKSLQLRFMLSKVVYFRLILLCMSASSYDRTISFMHSHYTAWPITKYSNETAPKLLSIATKTKYSYSPVWIWSGSLEGVLFSICFHISIFDGILHCLNTT